MNRTFAIISVLCLLSAACSNTDQCADCCPPGDNTSPVLVQCALKWPDGGAAAGVQARCTDDAGTVTDSSGAFSIPSRSLTCGIAFGSILCGAVRFSQDGGTLSATVSGSDAGENTVNSRQLTVANCRAVVAVP